MKSLVIYDSQYGNTEIIAHKIAEVFQARAVPVGKVSPRDLDGLQLLAAGSPTQRLTATPAMKDWIDSLPSGALDGVRAAAFDTRFTEEHINSIKVLPFFVRIFGYAAGPISRRLRKKGAEIITSSEGFYVSGTEGPLVEGELDRAGNWARNLLSAAGR